MKAVPYRLERPLATPNWPGRKTEAPPGNQRGLGVSDDDRFYQSSRATIRVWTGSFIAPRRSASRAMTSLTPSISNMIRPG